MWVASSAGRDDTATARVAGCSVSLDSEMDATPSGSGSSRTVAARVHRRPSIAVGYDTRHAGYFDGEWERP